MTFSASYIIKTTWSRDQLEKASKKTIEEYAEKVACRIYG